MALPKLFFSFLFLLLLSSSLHVHARDGQFLNYQPITQQPPTSTTTGTTSNPSGNTFTNTKSNNNKAYVTNSQGMSDTKFTDRGYTNPTGKSAADVLYRGESGESNAKNNYKNDASVTGSQGTEGDSKYSDPYYNPIPTYTPVTTMPPNYYRRPYCC